ncbi:unnamed protein product [Pleuronectes platessa]|uniref:Uncharacterized protein n=1 Tax=Pleuronectes platessa TaxID=8262 RepID=A0A9N7YPP5_PLEPL|nr:unnamed protein product [Pleuronectes platessa]
MGAGVDAVPGEVWGTMQQECSLHCEPLSSFRSHSTRSQRRKSSRLCRPDREPRQKVLELAIETDQVEGWPLIHPTFIFFPLSIPLPSHLPLPATTCLQATTRVPREMSATEKKDRKGLTFHMAGSPRLKRPDNPRRLD